jgi:hypothetical protein
MKEPENKEQGAAENEEVPSDKQKSDKLKNKPTSGQSYSEKKMEQ